MAECKRHRYQVTEAWPVEKKGPTGHRSGWWGMWEARECTKCGGKGDGRWASGITARSATAARAAYGVGAGLGDGAERRVEAFIEKRRAALGHAQRLREVATMLRGAKQALELDAACDCDRAAEFIRSHLTAGVKACVATHSRCPDVREGNVCSLPDGACDGQRTRGVTACNCAARLAGRVDGNVHFEGCPHFAPPNDALRRALGDIISQTVVAERMGYTDPQDWQEKFQRVRQIARDALGVKGPDHG